MPKSAEEASLNLPPPKKRRGFVRGTLLYTTLFGATFYAGSTLVSLHDSRYHDFFVESVPFGEGIMDYADSQHWDQVQLTRLPKHAVDASKSVYRTVEGAVSRTLGYSSVSPELPSSESVKDSVKSTAEKSKKAVSSGVTFVKKKTEEVQTKAAEVTEDAKAKALNFSKDVQDLVHEAEKALAGAPRPTTHDAETSAPPVDKSIYTGVLGIGFEPPPGYTRPAPPKKPSQDEKAPKGLPATPSLPLVAPAVRELSASEPVIAQIASSIDGLATLLKDSPTSTTGARDILDTAQVDLVKLGSRIEAIKKEEQAKLEAQLDEQAKEYSLKIHSSSPHSIRLRKRMCLTLALNHLGTS